MHSIRVNLLSLVPQDKDTYGGSFLYHLNEDSPLVAVGFVVSACTVSKVPRGGMLYFPSSVSCSKTSV